MAKYAKSGLVMSMIMAGFMASVACAQGRDPEYAAARANGQVGEKPSGYLGVVGAGNATLRHMVEDLNIKRKAVYADRAATQHATVEAYALTTGCRLIGQTEAGEKYMTPAGEWRTRTAAEPERDERCP